jgi:hypothetical protein
MESHLPFAGKGRMLERRNMAQSMHCESSRECLELVIGRCLPIKSDRESPATAVSPLLTQVIVLFAQAGNVGAHAVPWLLIP